MARGIAGLAEFVERNEPPILSYSVYFSGASDQMTVTHIHVYGEPTEWALGQLRRKVEMLGTGEVVVHPAHTGFGRFMTTAALPDQGCCAGPADREGSIPSPLRLS
jgi:hypothetical protein